MGLMSLGESLVRGSVVSVGKFLSTPTLNLSVTISFVGIKLVDMNVLLIREGASLEKTMEPIGSLIRTVISPGFLDNDDH